MAIQKRSTVMAVKVETTEGVPLAPAAASDYIAVQEDVDFEAGIEVLENAELKGSLGKSKSILGIENPTASFSHYLRASGVEGQAPNYKPFLKAAFGSESVRSTERNTVAGSTVSVLNVDSGEGVEFARGNFVLVKDATNGYSLRPVHSVATDALTLGFDLANAPASGVNLGKDISYSPANTGHQTLSLWLYQGNAGAVELISGGRVTEFGLSFSAGQLINGTYSLEGIQYYFNPLITAATDTKLDFTDDNGTFAATVAAQAWKDPHQLADAIAVSLNAADPLETFTVAYSNSTGKFTIATSTSAILSLLWNTGGNAANTIGDLIGFSVAADDTGAITYTSDSAISWVSPQTPSYDAADPLVAKSNVCLIGDATDNSCFQASSVEFALSTPKANINSICAESGRSGSIINSREVTVNVVALLNQYDADKFRRFRENDETRFFYAFGSKSGGNWEAGKSGGLYLPTATISSYNLADEDGLVTLELELKAFVDADGNGEVYLGFV